MWGWFNCPTVVGTPLGTVSGDPKFPGAGSVKATSNHKIVKLNIRYHVTKSAHCLNMFFHIHKAALLKSSCCSPVISQLTLLSGGERHWAPSDLLKAHPSAIRPLQQHWEKCWIRKVNSHDTDFTFIFFHKQFIRSHGAKYQPVLWWICKRLCMIIIYDYIIMTESRSVWNWDKSVFIELCATSNGPETRPSSSGGMSVKRQRKGQSCRGGSWMSRFVRRGAAACRRVLSAPSSHYISGVRRTGWTSLLCLPLRLGYNSLTWLNRTRLGKDLGGKVWITVM